MERYGMSRGTYAFICLLVIGVIMGAGALIDHAFNPPPPPARVVVDDMQDCRFDGNKICGPNNDWGYAPGKYRDGKLIEPWFTKLHYDRYARITHA